MLLVLTVSHVLILVFVILFAMHYNGMDAFSFSLLLIALCFVISIRYCFIFYCYINNTVVHVHVL